MKNTNVVEIKHMYKHFGPTVALDDVSITVRSGKILGLIGENGSGKSTVTSILAGMQKGDKGEMFFRGQVWSPVSMIDALNHGVGMIVQETGTIPGITVAENIYLGEIDQFTRKGVVNRKKLITEAQKILDNIGAEHINAGDVTAKVDNQDKKLIEIAKVMSKSPEVLIVDETTTALSQKGRKIIYKIMDQMKQENKAVIFISHDLEEIIKVCDELTVLRDGKIITTIEKPDFEEDTIKTSMIGRELKGDYYRSDFDGSYENEVVLELRKGRLGNQLCNVNLTLHKGEILGIGGLSNCGMHKLGKVLFGAEKLDSGMVMCHNRQISSENQAMKNKVGYVAKDRDIESLCLDASIKDNIAAAGFNQIKIGPFFIIPIKERKYVTKQIEKLRIKCNGMDQTVSSLSGGNKQKVVFGKWIGRDSEILILDCPTRGIDIGVKQSMYQLMYEMKMAGKSIIIISEEMAELIGMSDRLLIMKDGEIKQEFMRKPSLNESDIIRCMI